MAGRLNSAYSPPMLSSNEKPKKRVGWIGPRETTELAPCYQALRERATLVAHADRPEAFDVERYRDCHLIVAACPRPIVSPMSWRALIEAQSDTKLVQLLGVWCEGEGRTGKTLDRLERVFWHAWPAWLEAWSEAEASESLSGSVAIDCSDRELVAGLLATFEAEGLPAFWSRRSLATRPTVILWEGAQLAGAEAERLAATCRHADAIGAPVVAMLDFPRPETVAAAQAIGAAAVVGKPIDRAALLQVLQTVCRRHAAEQEATFTLPPLGLFAHEFGEGDFAPPARFVDRPDADPLDWGADAGERLVGAVAAD